MNTRHYIEGVSELTRIDDEPTWIGPSINTGVMECGIYHALDWIKSLIVEKECITHT